MRKYEGEPDYAAGEYDETERRFARGWFFHTAVGWLIIVNVAVYLLEIILRPPARSFTPASAASPCRRRTCSRADASGNC